VKDDKPAEISENDSINQNDSGSNNPEENPYIEKTPDVISPETLTEKESETIMLTNITQNTKLAFNVGDRFVYEFLEIEPAVAGKTFVKSSGTTIHYLERRTYFTEYSIVDKVGVDKIYYFKIQINRSSFISGTRTSKERGTEPMIIDEDMRIIYMNANTGEAGIIENDNIQKAPENNYPNYWLRPWMLALEDNIKWRQSTHDLSKLEKEDYGMDYWAQDFYVEGMEKIGGRECFKVVEEEKACQKNSNCQMTGKRIYHIDAEKRILVKVEKWWENLNIGETKLTDQNVFNKKQ
jgi:hypothetical protein